MNEFEVWEQQALFVIILPEVLVGRDIEMIIRDACPDARVLVTPNLRDAEKALPEGRIRAVFVQSEVAAILASSFGQRVANDSGLVVLVGQEELPALPEGWKALPCPFAGRDVAKLLSGIALAAAPRATAPGDQGSAGSSVEDQDCNVSVLAKNIACDTAERTCSSA